MHAQSNSSRRRTDGVDSGRVRRVGDHLLGQVHLGELRGEQQVLCRHSRAILRGSTEQLLEAPRLLVVLDAQLGLGNHLLLGVAA